MFLFVQEDIILTESYNFQFLICVRVYTTNNLLIPCLHDFVMKAFCWICTWESQFHNKSNTIKWCRTATVQTSDGDELFSKLDNHISSMSENDGSNPQTLQND